MGGKVYLMLGDFIKKTNEPSIFNIKVIGDNKKDILDHFL